MNTLFCEIEFKLSAANGLTIYFKNSGVASNVNRRSTECEPGFPDLRPIPEDDLHSKSTLPGEPNKRESSVHTLE
jgi:hypothetical protein